MKGRLLLLVVIAAVVVVLLLPEPLPGDVSVSAPAVSRAPQPVSASSLDFFQAYRDQQLADQAVAPFLGEG